MAEAFFQKHRKKGLAALLLLLFGGEKKNVLLLMVAGAGSLLVGGWAAMTGRLVQWEKAVERAAPKVVGQAAKEANFGEVEIDEVRRVARSRPPSGVPGKARSTENEAVGYVSRDPGVIAGAQAQRDLDRASDGGRADGTVHIARLGDRGLAGMQGAGSLGMVTAGEGLMSGGMLSVADSRQGLLSGLQEKMPKPPGVKEMLGRAGSGGAGAGRANRASKGGKLSAMNVKAANLRITKQAKQISEKKPLTMGLGMWQLVRAAAYTFASRCPNCAHESVTLYNRAYATGEIITGAGIITLPGADAVPVDASAVEQMLDAQNLGIAGVSKQSTECNKETVEPLNARLKELAKLMSDLRWDGHRLLSDTNGVKCCEWKDYNDRVRDFKTYCKEYNEKQELINTKCGIQDPNAGKRDCGVYSEQDTCGWLECYIGAIIAAVVAIAAIAAAVLIPGLGTLAVIALAGVAAGALGYAAMDLGLF